MYYIMYKDFPETSLQNQTKNDSESSVSDVRSLVLWEQLDINYFYTSAAYHDTRLFVIPISIHCCHVILTCI